VSFTRQPAPSRAVRSRLGSGRRIVATTLSTLAPVPGVGQGLSVPIASRKWNAISLRAGRDEIFCATMKASRATR